MSSRTHARWISWIAPTCAAVILTIGLCWTVQPAMADVTPSFPLNTTFNVAHNSSVTIQSIDPTDPLFHAEEIKAYPGPTGGIVANSLTWTGFLRQSGRVITVNLGHPTQVDSISLQFMEFTSDSILFPSYVNFQVSQDGQHWYEAGKVNSTVAPFYGGKLLQTYAVTLDRIPAQYVRIQFPVDVWALARNLRIIGSPWQRQSLVQLPAVPPNGGIQGYLAPKSASAGGIGNMLLVYSGANGAEGTWTPQQFLPMVAYVSPTGQIEGQMFDSFLFLPYGSLLKTAGDWNQYLTSLFAPNEQLSALNQTVANAAAGFKQIGVAEPTVNVVLAIPYPNPGITNFGRLPYGSQYLSFNSKTVGAQTAYQNRMAAITWYVRTLLSKWKAAHFTNLKLVGLYWDSESVNYSTPYETNVIQDAVALAHNAHLPLLWIPTFDAPGLISWNELGFDSVFIQSHYYEEPRLPVARVTETSDIALQNGFGMEVELGPQILQSATYRHRYFNELVADYLSGVETQAAHAFYDGSQVLYDAAYSTNPSVRSLYVDTYDFILGQFTYSTYKPVG